MVIDTDMDELLCKTLKCGSKLPTVGFSATNPSSPTEVALQSGYRHILTDIDLQSAPPAGRAIARWLQSARADRNQLFVTTQLGMGASTNVNVRAQCLKCLYNLRCEYLDMVVLQKLDQSSLINDSTGKQQLVQTWQAMESMVREGQVRSLAVRNFDSTEMEYLISQCSTPPSVLVVDWTSIRQDRGRLSKLRNYCKYRELQLVISLQIQDILESDDQWCACVRSMAAKFRRPVEQVGVKAIQMMNLPVVVEESAKEEIPEAFKVFDWSLDIEDKDMLEQSIYQ